MRRTNLNLPTATPQQVVISQQKFNAGVITVVDQSNIPRNALKQAINMVLAENGVPTKRPGLDWYGEEVSGDAIQGSEIYTTDSGDVELVAVANGDVYRSQDNGDTWESCTGATFTVGTKINFLQANHELYIFNGVDTGARYDGTTTLVTHTAISEPSSLTVSKTGLSGTSYTYYYAVVSYNDVGHTLASNVYTRTVGSVRSTFDDSNYCTLSWTNPSGTKGTEIYIGTESTKLVYIDSIVGSATTYIDKGLAPERVSVLIPTDNTTGGPVVGQMRFAGNRIVATQDATDKERLWISGTGANIGTFTSAYDAAYIDFQKGTGLSTTIAEDYRDGKGTPLITVWCNTPDNKGCVWQGSLESYTVSNTSFLVPVFYKLPGSRGTNAPGSVVNVMNDWLFYNRQAMYNLGSRASFLNLLSTDEITVNIRPNMKNINKQASSGIASHFSDGLVYFSVPTTTEHNDTTMVYDTERKAWIPQAFTVGFEQIFDYTDTDGNTITLCWKHGDTKLTQISTLFNTDYGQPIQTTITTGLFPVNPKNRFDFIECDTAELEFAQHAGNTSVELYGVTREDGFKKLVDTMTVATAAVRYSWSNIYFSEEYWSTYASDIETAASEPTKKVFFEVLQEINSYQFKIKTTGANDEYLLRTLQVTGTPSEQGKAPNWQIF